MENKQLALLLTVICVRNTVIESYHEEGKLSQAEMMAFNKEVVNKLYTTLEFLGNPEYQDDKRVFEKLISEFYPHDWDEPQMDTDFVEAVQHAKGQGW